MLAAYENNKKAKTFQYILVFGLLAFSYFEYFFRDPVPKFVFCLFLVAYTLLNKQRLIEGMTRKAYVVLLVFFVFTVLQTIAFGLSFNNTVGRMVVILNGFFIVLLLKDKFYIAFVKVLYYITAISLILYGVCYLDRSICAYFIYQVCPQFTSLNVEQAAIEGGGLNIIIFNFLNNPLLTDALWRNSGPFWEPGMFALFINLALFINIFILENRSQKFNLLLILGLISTFSTGGYIGAVVIMVGLAPKIKSLFLKAAYICILVFSVPLVYNLDFVGEKVTNQIYADDDLSRFGAGMLQLKMTQRSPLWGGQADLKIQNDEGVLANGITNVFVTFGAFVGLFYYIMLYKSIAIQCRRLDKSRYTQILFFILLLVLAFSQTITTTSIYFSLLMLGFIKINNKRSRNGLPV